MSILFNNATGIIIGSVVIVIILILLIVLGILALKVFKALSKKKKDEANELLNNFYESDEFLELHNLTFERVQYYGGLDQVENFKHYETILSPKKSIKTYDDVLVVFNNKTVLFLNEKISAEEYSDFLESYIFLEGYIKKNMIESMIDEDSQTQEEFYSYEENIFGEDETYPDEFREIGKEIELNNNYVTSSEIELLDDDYYRNYDNKITNIIYPKKVSKSTPRPKIESIYKPSRSVVLHVDQVVNDMEEVVKKMSTDEQLKYLDDFFD